MILGRGSKALVRRQEVILAAPGRCCSCGLCRIAGCETLAPGSQEMLVEKLICHYSACKAELLRFADVTARIHGLGSTHGQNARRFLRVMSPGYVRVCCVWVRLDRESLSVCRGSSVANCPSLLLLPAAPGPSSSPTKHVINRCH